MSTMIMTEKFNPMFCTQEQINEFLSNGGRRLIAACILENAPHLPFADMMQECLITAAHALHMYDPSQMQTKVTTYIWICCENTIKMTKRKAWSQKAQAACGVISLDEAKNEKVDQEPHIVEALDKKAEAEMLHRAIDDPDTGLTDEEHIVINMTMGGYPQTAIGEVIGVSQSQVSKRYKSALSKLKAALISAGMGGVSNV